ncbi:class I SAM-dependent methyltransferase [Thiohalorhabdus sp.]|uniref:class I SAM-dependent methyltransferase n=1 Tax=Thiohalorhabdus sp. TaxID=3094134 RepID=UPI002FC32353
MIFKRRHKRSESSAPPELCVRWSSEHARHTDRLRLAGTGSRRGRGKDLTSMAASVVPAWDETRVTVLEPNRLDRRVPAEGLRAGRFYPAALVDGDAPQASGGVFYVIDADPSGIRADFNHPLSPYALELFVTNGARPSRETLTEALGAGPGMQGPIAARGPGPDETGAYAREDECSDTLFYERPRLVAHLDATALAHVRALYSRFIGSGMAVLDLMASWDSHLPAQSDLEVTGLGMNRQELEHNAALTERVVHDLNADPRLPFPAARFDAAVCTVSLEYLIDPVPVLREVGRVLVPGAPAVIVCSDRWFPPKVTRLWTELHPFERVGLVAYWMRESGWFTDIATESIRGDSRPADDPHWGQRSEADPVFAVWGRVEP